MNRLRVVLSLWFAWVVPMLHAAEPLSSDASSFEATKARIDALFHNRDAVLLLPADLRNPFSRPDERRPGSGINPTDADAARQPALSDRALLERAATVIQIRGIVESNGHPSLIINRKLFDEGDKLTVLYGTTPVEIVIKRIASETFTLGYKDAELTLRLPR